MAQLLQRLGQSEQSRTLFETATNTLEELINKSANYTSLRDELAAVFKFRGRMYFESGDTAQASMMFARAKSTWEALLARPWPTASQQLNNYARFLVTCPDDQMRDPDRAVELMRIALAEAEDNPTYHSTLGIAFYRRGDLISAQESLDYAIRLRGEGNATDWFFLCMVLWKQEQKQRARESLEKGERWMQDHRPENPELQQFRREARVLLGVE